MAFSLPINSSLMPSSQNRKMLEESNYIIGGGVLKPITITGNPPTFVSAAGRRIVAVGDLHGDLSQTRSALEISGVLSSDGQDLWTGGQTVLVQLGDILDRGEDEIAILSLLRSLNIQAESSGGAVFQRQKGIIARSSLFRPGGLLACELARHPVILKVDDWIFCHGGLLPHHVAYGIQRMNREVSHWMRGFGEDNDIPVVPFIATRGYDSVVWNRLYSKDPANLEYQTWQISSIAEKTLQSVGAKGMVVGHTPQINGANCKHNERIWCIDVGMSSGVLNSRPEVLEIVSNKARVLRNQDDTIRELEVADYL